MAATADAADAAFDLVLESDGGASLTAAFAKVAQGGTIVTFGNSSREPSQVSFPDFAGREASCGRTSPSCTRARPGRGSRRSSGSSRTAGWTRAWAWRPDWTELNDALQALADRAVAGKVVLRRS